MNATISDLKGLQPEVKTKLEFEGIRNTQQFLERTRTPQQRTELAHKVGATPVALKELANRADLMRLAGVGETSPICWKKPESIAARNCNTGFLRSCTPRSQPSIPTKRLGIAPPRLLR